MIDSRIIPTIDVPPEQTNASLRKLLREAHEREQAARDLLCIALGLLKSHAIGDQKQAEIERFLGDK